MLAELETGSDQVLEAVKRWCWKKYLRLLVVGRLCPPSHSHCRCTLEGREGSGPSKQFAQAAGKSGKATTMLAFVHGGEVAKKHALHSQPFLQVCREDTGFDYGTNAQHAAQGAVDHPFPQRTAFETLWTESTGEGGVVEVRDVAGDVCGILGLRLANMLDL
jgi:hypothetical protein